MRRLISGMAAAGAAVAAARRVVPSASPDVSCPVCGTTGSPYYPHPYKVWEHAGRDDDGTYLRRCRKCGAEVALHRPFGGFAWWLPTEVRLVSPSPRYGKGRARRRARRDAS